MAEPYFRPIPCLTQQQIERFHRHVHRGTVAECWNWTGCVSPHNGYGRVGFQQGSKAVTYAAHRIAFTLAYGCIPTGLSVLHKCDNPPCCNPHHLFTGTQQDNIADCIKKGRARKRSPSQPKSRPGYARGERIHLAKLTEESVRIMRSLFSQGVSSTIIARQFGVTQPTAKVAIIGRTWKHVK